MRCTNKRITALLMLSCTILTGCGREAYSLPYSVDNGKSSYQIVDVKEESKSAETFAADLCVVEQSSLSNANIEITASGAGLFDVNGINTIYAKNVYEQMAPASLTKVMTALVALKEGEPDMILTASDNVKITESGAQLLGLKKGDQMTLTQALYVLLVYSANDAAVMIAEGVAGSVEEFAKLMNEEAYKIGATNSNFVNPHGLTDDSHYTTVYDMYLILNEAVKYSLFNDIIRTPSYTSTYTDANGDTKEIDIKNTNLYLQEVHTSPENITVIGGKTGTTNAAGHCLLLLSKDTSDNPYISIIMKAESRDDLYLQMTNLLTEISGMK